MLVEALCFSAAAVISHGARGPLSTRWRAAGLTLPQVRSTNCLPAGHRAKGVRKQPPPTKPLSSALSHDQRRRECRRMQTGEKPRERTHTKKRRPLNSRRVQKEQRLRERVACRWRAFSCVWCGEARVTLDRISSVKSQPLSVAAVLRTPGSSWACPFLADAAAAANAACCRGGGALRVRLREEARANWDRALLFETFPTCHP